MKQNRFEKLGVMIDMSRNAVMSIDGLKRFLPLLADMGYNTVMLYTEDTFEVEDEPFFGYMRGRYSKAEIKEIDALCISLGIELIPCIQTLAHLEKFFRWEQVPIDYGGILLVDDEKTYEFIEKLFKSCSECFTTNKIHIGMDEAWMLGRGKHLDIHGYESSDECMKRHLERVNRIGKKYGYDMMMWSDMFLKNIGDGSQYYYMGKTEIPKAVKDAIPEDMTIVYWDYYHFNKDDYGDMLYNHMQMTDKVWFAGGLWSWSGLVPHNKSSIKSMIPALDACEEYGVKNIIFTMWGDNGAECSHFSQLPSLFYMAEYAKGEKNEENIKQKFENKFGISYDDFLLIDALNDICESTNPFANPSKYMFYCDTLKGIFDCTVSGTGLKYYSALAKKLTAVSKKTDEYAYLFKTAASLAKVLAIKYDLGVRIRRAYKEDKKDELARICTNDFPSLIRRVNDFHKVYRAQWYMDNKTFGFDAQDIRLGGLASRLASCRLLILDYVNGKTDKIEELEEEILVLPNSEQGKSMHYHSHNAFEEITTVNLI